MGQVCLILKDKSGATLANVELPKGKFQRFAVWAFFNRLSMRERIDKHLAKISTNPVLTHSIKRDKDSVILQLLIEPKYDVNLEPERVFYSVEGDRVPLLGSGGGLLLGAAAELFIPGTPRGALFYGMLLGGTAQYGYTRFVSSKGCQILVREVEAQEVFSEFIGALEGVFLKLKPAQALEASRIAMRFLEKAEKAEPGASRELATHAPIVISAVLKGSSQQDKLPRFELVLGKLTEYLTDTGKENAGGAFALIGVALVKVKPEHKVEAFEFLLGELSKRGRGQLAEGYDKEIFGLFNDRCRSMLSGKPTLLG